MDSNTTFFCILLPIGFFVYLIVVVVSDQVQRKLYVEVLAGSLKHLDANPADRNVQLLGYAILTREQHNYEKRRVALEDFFYRELGKRYDSQDVQLRDWRYPRWALQQFVLRESTKKRELEGASDESAFWSAQECYRHAAELSGKQVSEKQLRAALKTWGVRVRKPGKQRLSIHIGDFLKMLRALRSGADPLDFPAEQIDSAVREVKERTEMERARKAGR